MSRSTAEEIESFTDPDFMNAFARGLAVIRAFSDQRRSMTIAQISHKTGIPRASVRRCLHTLKQLGYADVDDNHFTLKPKILTLGYSYLSSTELTVSVMPHLNALSRRLNQSCSLAVLDSNEVLYVARSAASRITSAALNPGSRLPAYCTALGRAILAYLPQQQLETYFEQVELKAYTERTVVSPDRLRELLISIRSQGYALLEEEFEAGLRSLAVPVAALNGRVSMALNVSAPAKRMSGREMKQDFLSPLRQLAGELSSFLP
jgi:IclR family pca regulon transcriptional regulator